MEAVEDLPADSLGELAVRRCGRSVTASAVGVGFGVGFAAVGMFGFNRTAARIGNVGGKPRWLRKPDAPFTVRASFGHHGPLYHCPLDHRPVLAHGPLARRRHMVRRHWSRLPALVENPSLGNHSGHRQPPTSHPSASTRRMVSRPSSRPLRRSRHSLRRLWNGAVLLSAAVARSGCSHDDDGRPLDRRLCRDGGGADAADPAGASNWAPVHSADFPDPDILQWQGGYYAFATQSTPPEGGHQVNIQVSFSTDGETWNTWGLMRCPTAASVPGPCRATPGLRAWPSFRRRIQRRDALRSSSCTTPPPSDPRATSASAWPLPRLHSVLMWTHHRQPMVCDNDYRPPAHRR